MLVCPNCGYESAESFKFCPECGTPAGLPAGEQRKTVTVLFADLVGSTALGERTDPEALRAVMRRYHSELRTILEQHGGSVEKFVGDAAMAVFGIPQSHEDDALRAVRAAEQIREAVGVLELQTRIGVNTGEVVTGVGETLVTGDAVNVAARLEQAAGPGEILLGESTHILVSEAVRSEPVGPLELKGKTAPVAAHRLLETLPEIPAFTRVIDAAFVGRTDELGSLERTLQRVIDERSPYLVTIVGPPGIGKSRLARELLHRSHARVLIGRCLSYGEGITYWPLAEVISQVGDVRSALGDDDDARLAASRIAAALGDAEATASSEEIGWGFRKLFEALARTHPLIVLLDDIHWAEATMLDLVEYVATFARDAPLLLLCMARPDLFEHRPAWATPKPNATLLTLGPLAEEQTERLVDELGVLPESSKARIVEAADGNPLFVEQLVAMQAETGNGHVEIPPTIQALLAARIDRLEPDERAVIERAAVEGRQFHRGAVQELVPPSARAGVGGHLLTLVRKEFIRPDRSQFPGDDGFRFGHILIRDAAYDSIPKKLRAELHERFANWLEPRLSDEVPEEIVAYHLEQAHRFRVELEPEDEHARRLALRAGRLLAKEGRRAHARSDSAATRSLLERATELLPADDDELPALLETLGYVTHDGGDLRGALEVLRRAQLAAAGAGQRNVELRARLTELVVLLVTDPKQATEAALAEARAAIAELTPLGDAESLARAWWVVTEVGAVRSDFALVEEAARNRLDFSRQAGLHQEAFWAAAWLTLAFAQGPTPVEEAIPRAEEALADLSTDRSGDFHLALLYAYAGRDDEARETIERARHDLLELGQRTLHASMAMNAGWIALLAAQPEQVEHDLQTAAGILEEGGESGALSTVAAVLAEVLYRLGRLDEAEEWTRRSEAKTAPEDVMSQALWRSVRAKVCARRREAKEALRLSAEAVDWARRIADSVLLGDVLLSRGEVLSLLGREGEARAVRQEALGMYERKGVVPSIEHTRALLSETV